MQKESLLFRFSHTGLSFPFLTASMHLLLFVGGGYVCLCFGYALLYTPSRFAIILMSKRELVPLLLLSFGCLVTVNVMRLFLTVPWVGLQFEIVVFPDHTHLLLSIACPSSAVPHQE